MSPDAPAGPPPPRHTPLAAPAGMSRRSLLLAGLAPLAGAGLGACASAGPRPDRPAWQQRLDGDTLALLGEVHDHPGLHRLRREALGAALARGWRPTLVLEAFDTDRQADVDRALRERPRDAEHLIASAGSPRGWDWPLYQPLLAQALAHGLPIVAGNLSRQAAGRVVREGYAAAFGPSELEALGLAAPLPQDLVEGQAREIDIGHCGAMPAAMLEPMARAQFARDAVMAACIATAAPHGGVVLLAGNGHVRRDLGAPRWLAPALLPRSLVVGFVEAGPGRVSDPAETPVYDVVVEAAAVRRPDPCEALGASVARSR